MKLGVTPREGNSRILIVSGSFGTVNGRQGRVNRKLQFAFLADIVGLQRGAEHLPQFFFRKYSRLLVGFRRKFRREEGGGLAGRFGQRESSARSGQ